MRWRTVIKAAATSMPHTRAKQATKSMWQFGLKGAGGRRYATLPAERCLAHLACFWKLPSPAQLGLLSPALQESLPKKLVSYRLRQAGELMCQRIECAS